MIMWYMIIHPNTKYLSHEILFLDMKYSRFTVANELYGAHTPHAAASTSFTYILCQIVCMSRKHMVGSIHRRAGPTKCSICDAHGPWQTIQSIMKPVFRQYRRICCSYESLRCLDLQIQQFLC